MTDKNDVSAALLAATLLLLTVGYLAQCSPAPHHGATNAVAIVPTRTAALKDEEHEAGEQPPRSVHELADQEERDEREKIKGVVRAMQTIGADPEMQKTYGFRK